MPDSHERQVARSERWIRDQFTSDIVSEKGDFKASTNEPKEPVLQKSGSKTTQSKRGDSWQDEFLEFMNKCEITGISMLEGNTINLPMFENKLPACVEAGTVSQADCDYILHGLRHGFDLHVDESKLPGKRVFRNYKSAYESKSKVHSALKKRVCSGKTLKLGQFNGSARDLPGTQGRTVSQGAVAKKLEPDAARPFSDHTKSQFNSACDIEFLDHSLNTYEEISKELKPGYSMRVEDIDGAYPVLPLAPRTWKYMYVWWYDVDAPLEEQLEPNTLYVHVFGDFGTSAMPGIWDKFFRCVKAMATLDGVLTLPMPHYVDDNSLIGPEPAAVDAEAEKLGHYLVTCGLAFKALKSRVAAARQLVIGFWWDSVERTRTLEREKLAVYMEMFRSISRRRTVTLHELQVVVGRAHRAIMTMPPGSNIFLARLLPLMRGLTMPWHQRRLTAGAREDLQSITLALEHNAGRGYFCREHLPWADDLYTDAMRDDHTAAWGWVSADGRYDFGSYGSAQRRKPIDALEGDAVLRAAKVLGPSWAGKRVRLHIDNTAFQLSFLKGRSRVERLSKILRQLYILSLKYDCVFCPVWISTHDNVGADALSRGNFGEFRRWAKLSFGSHRVYRCRHATVS